MLVKRYKIAMYDVRKIARAKKRMCVPDSEPLDAKMAEQFFTNYVALSAPEQHIPEEEQEYDMVWIKEPSETIKSVV